MGDTLHKNYKKASNLIFATLLLEPIEFFFLGNVALTSNEKIMEGLSLAFIALTAYAARRGVIWVKYILLVLNVLSLASIIMYVRVGGEYSTPLLISLIQVIAMSWALVLLFQIPASNGQDPLDSEI